MHKLLYHCYLRQGRLHQHTCSCDEVNEPTEGQRSSCVYRQLLHLPLPLLWVEGKCFWPIWIIKNCKSRVDDWKICWLDYTSTSFNYRLRTFVLSLPKKCLLDVFHVVKTIQLQDNIPIRLALMIRNLITHRRNRQVTVNNSVGTM